MSVEGFKQYLTGVEGSRVPAGAWLRDNVPGEDKVLREPSGMSGTSPIATFLMVWAW